MTFKNILFPVDFSDRSRAIAPFVRAHVERHKACLTLASFIETPAIWYGASDVPVVPELDIPRLIQETGHSRRQLPGPQHLTTPND